MAENGILEGILGGVEGEEREAEETGFRAEAAATAVATAVAIDAARYDPELSRAASDYLNEQRVLVRASTELVRIQVHHSDEERELSIQAAKRKRFSDHFRMSFQVFMTLVATVICVGVGVMVWEAATSKSVVLDSFDSPAPLVAQGLTGKVMASRVLDALEELQDATRAVNGGWTSTNAWPSDVKIELPETGISIGEINHPARASRPRYPHQWRRRSVQGWHGDAVRARRGRAGLALQRAVGGLRQAGGPRGRIYLRPFAGDALRDVSDQYQPQCRCRAVPARCDGARQAGRGAGTGDPVGQRVGDAGQAR